MFRTRNSNFVRFVGYSALLLSTVSGCGGVSSGVLPNVNESQTPATAPASTADLSFSFAGPTMPVASGVCELVAVTRTGSTDSAQTYTVKLVSQKYATSSAPAPTAAFFSDSSCQDAIGDSNPLKVGAGLNTINFYFLGTNSETTGLDKALFTFSNGSESGDLSVTVEVAPAEPLLMLSTSATTSVSYQSFMLPSTCTPVILSRGGSSTATAVYYASIESSDASAPADAAMGIFADAGCEQPFLANGIITIPAGQASFMFYVKSASDCPAGASSILTVSDVETNVEVDAYPTCR